MKTNTQIHLANSKNYDVLYEIYADFDSKEKAAQFVDKLNNRPTIEMIDGILNPDYSIDKTTAPYYISLEQTGRILKDIFICEYNLNAENRKEEYNICFYGVSKPSQGYSS